MVAVPSTQVNPDTEKELKGRRRAGWENLS